MALTRNSVPRTTPVAATAAALLALCLAGPATAAPTQLHPAPHAHTAAAPADPQDISAIVAIVNGDVISRTDVNNRRRLFALSTGLPLTKEVLDRLAPQITRQLIDEKLRLQEVQRLKIVIGDKEIAGAIANVEKRNNMAPGTLRARLASDGVGLETLIDQVRVQLGWTRVLREALGRKTHIGATEIADRLALLKSESGKPEFRVSEIFIPIDEPPQGAQAHAFADTVIKQLRAGAPFGVVAAQFSQSQTALEGGDLGWIQLSQVDPEVAKVLAIMPAGAISDPVDVAGGIEIISLRAKRVIGNDPGTALDMRQAFLPFTTPLDPAHPTDQQKQTLLRAKALEASAHSCADIEQANKAAGDVHPSDPGLIQEENLSPPQFREMISKLPVGKPSQLIVSNDGIGVMMICSRESHNFGLPSGPEIANQILSERVEQASRTLMRELHRRAIIDLRNGGV